MIKTLFSELKKRKIDIIFEFFSLFLGLTAALWLDDYRDKRNENEFTEKIILDIRAEYKAVSELENETKENQKFVDTISFFIEKSFDEIEKLKIFDGQKLTEIRTKQDKKFSFVDIIELTKSKFNDSYIANNSWQILSNQNVKSFDYGLIKILNNIENSKKALDFQTNRLTSKYNLFKPLEKHELPEMTNIMMSMYGTKMNLIKNVKEFLVKTESFEKHK